MDNPIPTNLPKSATARQYLNQLDQLRSRFSEMTPANTNDVYRKLSAAVDDFRPQYGELRQQQAQSYSLPAQRLNEFNQQYGTEDGPSALNRLSSVMQDVARSYGTTNTMADVLSQQRGRLEDLARGAYEQYANERNALLQEYGLVSPLYNLEEQMQESFRNRLFQSDEAKAAYERQLEMMRMQQDWQTQEAAKNRALGSGLFNSGFLTGGGETTPNPIINDINNTPDNIQIVVGGTPDSGDISGFTDLGVTQEGVLGQYLTGLPIIRKMYGTPEEQMQQAMAELGGIQGISKSQELELIKKAMVYFGIPENQLENYTGPIHQFLRS